MGDYQVRFFEDVGVKFPCVTRLHTVFFYKLVLKCQPGKGLTVAQFGPPSLPVPGIFVSRTKEESASICLIISDEISLKGIFSLRVQTELV